MSVALYVIAGMVMFLVMNFAGYFGVDDAAITPLSVAVWIPCAWAFLASVHKSKKFLTESGLTTLDDFGSTVFWFAVPFANFYVPWKRLATIRNSLSHYLKTGDMEEHEGGRGSTLLLGALYMTMSLSDRIVSNLPLEEQETLWPVPFTLWVVSFVYSSVWLATLARKRAKAEKRLKTDPSIAEVFA